VGLVLVGQHWKFDSVATAAGSCRQVDVREVTW
jgi:hypothetical protein